jgi:hypothetical protein
MAQSHSLSAIFNGNNKENTAVIASPAGALGEIPNAAGSMGVSTLIQTQKFSVKTSATAGYTVLTTNTLTNTGIFIPQNSQIVNFDIYTTQGFNGTSPTINVGYNGDGTGQTFLNAVVAPTTITVVSLSGVTTTVVGNWMNSALLALTPLTGSLPYPVLQLNIKAGAADSTAGEFIVCIEYAYLG